MAVLQWTSTAGGFESTPAGSTSAADGDDRIRELKETAGALLDKEHKARDAGSVAAQGWHREGSAIAYYEATAPTNRPDGATALSDDDAGRLWVDSDDGTLDYWDGSAWQDAYGQDLTTAGDVVFNTVNGMTDAEMSQIENIGATTISAAQWGYVGGANQNVRTTDDVTFNSVTIDGGKASAHYTGSTQEVTNYPIGTILFVTGSVRGDNGTQRPYKNQTATVYNQGSQSFTLDSGDAGVGASLSGTWRSRGLHTGSNVDQSDWAYVMQRTA